MNGEGKYPGSGGNLNSTYSGDGDYHPQAEDFGYNVTAGFPSGALPVGTEGQEFRISDSAAFNNLRGIAKTNFPFDPNPSNDNPNARMTSLVDKFQPTDVAGVSSLMPGKYNYNNMQGVLGREILDEFDAGTSTYNSLPTGASAYNNDLYGSGNFDTVNKRTEAFTGINSSNLIDQYRAAYASTQVNDVPLTPFHYQYPNFGNGQVDYGFQEPGAESMDSAIVKGFNAVLPSDLAGTKTELMPVFSSVNQLALEQRPLLQSLGYQKNTLWLGGSTTLPDSLTVSPLMALQAGSNIPVNLTQSAGELASALTYLSYTNADGLSTGNPYGQHVPNNRMLDGTTTQPMNPQMYSWLTTESNEPFTFANAEGSMSALSPGLY